MSYSLIYIIYYLYGNLKVKELSAVVFIIGYLFKRDICTACLISDKGHLSVPPFSELLQKALRYILMHKYVFYGVAYRRALCLCVIYYIHCHINIGKAVNINVAVALACLYYGYCSILYYGVYKSAAASWDKHVNIFVCFHKLGCGIS